MEPLDRVCLNRTPHIKDGDTPGPECGNDLPRTCILQEEGEGNGQWTRECVYVALRILFTRRTPLAKGSKPERVLPRGLQHALSLSRTVSRIAKDAAPFDHS